MRTPRLSLRTRATVVATLIVGVTLTVGSVLLVTTLEDRLTTASDQLARSRVGDLLDLAAHGDLPPVVRNPNDEGVAQVVDAEGRVVAASPNITGRPAIAHLDPGDGYVVRVIDAPDDAETETYRVWAGAGESPTGPVTVYAGSSLESVSEASATLRRSLWVGVPLVVVVLGFAIWLVLGRALARLDRIRAEVDEITEDRLDARVAGDGTDEVGRLAATMNAMLARLEAAARRQRDFVADVSHDLQSPLAAQRVSLELALARPDDIDTDRLRTEVLGATTEMERLVRDLLVLAAADERAPVETALIDLDELVLEEAARARTAGRAVVDTSAVSAAPARAVPDDVRRVVRNLLDNATGHAAGRVELVVDVVDGRARLDVLDDGPGVPAQERELIFDRFHRGDLARSRGRGSRGSGLGLAIARTLAERSGGRLDLVATSGGAHFRLVLPGPDGERTTGAPSSSRSPSRDRSPATGPSSA